MAALSSSGLPHTVDTPQDSTGRDVHEPRAVLSDPEDILPKGPGNRSSSTCKPIFGFDLSTSMGEGGDEDIMPAVLRRSDGDASKGDQPMDSLDSDQRLVRVSKSPVGAFESARRGEDDKVCWACSSCVKSKDRPVRSRIEEEEVVLESIGTMAEKEEEALARVEEEIEKLRRALSPTRKELMEASRTVEQLLSKHFSNTTKRKVQEFKVHPDLKDNSLSDSTAPDVGTYEKDNRGRIFPGKEENMEEEVEITVSNEFKYDSISDADSFESVKSENKSSADDEGQKYEGTRTQKQNEWQEQGHATKPNTYVDCLAVTLDDDSDDEMSVEESRVFLEAFKINSESTAGNTFSGKGFETEDNESQHEMGLHTIEEAENASDDSFSSRESEDEDKPKMYFPLMKSNLKPDDGGNITLEEEGSTSVLDCEGEDKQKLFRVSSTWWSTDISLASDILRELQQAVEWFGGQQAAEISNSVEELEEVNTATNASELELTIEQAGTVLSNISAKIGNMLSEQCDEQLSNVVKVFFDFLDYPFGDLNSAPVNEDEPRLVASIKEVSETFSFVSDLLNNVPQDVKHEPLSILNPPESLTKTLTLLASNEDFESCFATALEQGSRTEVETSGGLDEQCNEITLSGEGVESEIRDDKLGCEASSLLKKQAIKIMMMMMEDDSKPKLRRFFPLSSQNPVETKHHLSCYESYLGLSPDNMTLGDLSNMLLLMSSVLNDFPGELKSAKFSDLNPPSDLLQGLNILYEADDIDKISDLERSESFLALTLQEVSDFALTLSKLFRDDPSDIPNSLAVAVALLTSLLSNSASEQEWSTPALSRESFFDAIESVSCLN